MLRLAYWKMAPAANRATLALSNYLRQSDVEQELLDLVYLRTSQINGCTYCVDMHSTDLRSRGVSQRKLDAVVVWREAPFFSERERAALDWAESLTRIADTGAPDEVYAALGRHFSDKEMIDLTFAIADMNLFNRIAVGFRRAPSLEEEVPS